MVCSVESMGASVVLSVDAWLALYLADVTVFGFVCTIDTFLT